MTAFACPYDARSQKALPPLRPRLCRDLDPRVAAATLRQRLSYRDGSGNTVSQAAIKARIRQLAIPPAWIEVCIAADERAHIQAIGRDAEGRLQYRYHPDWDKARASAKEGRLKRLGSALPRVRSAYLGH